MSGLRVLCCGGRDYASVDHVFAALDALRASNEIALIIHGQARGADYLSGAWAKKRGVPWVEMPANWDAFRKRAGHLRNQAMLDLLAPNYVVAFPGGSGTADMVKIATAAGLTVWQPYGATP